MILQGGDCIAVVAAGLPNITGSFVEYNSSMGDIIIQKQGAFSDGGKVEKTDEHYIAPSSVNYEYGYKTIFDASKCNAVYREVDTIQPAAIMDIPQSKF